MTTDWPDDDPWQNLDRLCEDQSEHVYVEIKPRELAELSYQTDTPFWDRLWIQPELKALLFGNPEDAGRFRTYLIVDASRRKNVTKVFDLDIGNLPIRCLFKGDAEDELKEVAPYLIDMTLSKDTTEYAEFDLSFHKDFFRNHWGQNTGIFVQTDAGIDEVWGHFRKFTKAVMKEDRRKMFFMFHDPRILPAYLQNVQTDAGKVRCFCSTEGGTFFRFIAENGHTSAIEITPDATRLAQMPRPAFVLSYEDFRPQAEAQKVKRAGRIANRIKGDFPDELKSVNLNKVTDIALRVVDRFIRYGFTRQEYLHYFVVWSVFFGEGFEQHDPDGFLNDICQSKASEDDRFSQFKERVDSFRIQPAEAP